jgi:hypothetical protein
MQFPLQQERMADTVPVTAAVTMTIITIKNR